MHKFLSLTKVTLKNTVGMVSDGRSKKSTAAILYGILFVSLIPLAFVIFMMFQSAFEMFAKLDQAGVVFSIALHFTSFIIFFFAVFMVPSIFFFSKDGETLLALPLTPQAILGSKFVVVLLYEYIFTFMILLPIYAAYISVFSFSVPFLIIGIIILLLVPIYPLVLSSIISMLVMRFVPFFKNRDRFNLISGLVTIVAAFTFSFYYGNITSQQDPTAILNTLMSGHNSLIDIFGYVFPGGPFAARALIDHDFIQLLIFIGIIAIAIFAFLMVGKAFYFKGLIGFSETGSSRKKLSEQDYNKLNHKKNRILTYTMKELKLLIRTPIYFMNCIGTSFIFPILICIIPMIEKGGGASPMEGLSAIPDNFFGAFGNFWPYLILGGIILGIFVSNINLISSTSISREGTNISFMKYIPMPLDKQLHAKALSGIIISVLTDALMLIAVYFLVPILPIYMLVIVFITSLVGIVLGNYVGLLVDVLHPKLIWEQEAAAVKQNMAGIISMLVGLAIAVALGVFAFLVPTAMLPYLSIGILLLMIVLFVIVYKGIGKIAQKAFKNY